MARTNWCVNVFNKHIIINIIMDYFMTQGRMLHAYDTVLLQRRSSRQLVNLDEISPFAKAKGSVGYR
jgi:hypothetical protein